MSEGVLELSCFVPVEKALSISLRDSNGTHLLCDYSQLRVPYSVPKYQDLLRPGMIGLVVLLDSLDEGWLQQVNQLLATGLYHCAAIPPRHACIGGGHDACYAW